MRPVAESQRILIVDDLPENIRVLGGMLAPEHTVQFATDGATALELARTGRPDLILLDLLMPGMDGFEVCRRLKADPATVSIPVIFITAGNDPDTEARCFEAGGVDFIHKPVSAAVVQARAGLHLRLRVQERALRSLNATLEQRVTERTEALREALRRADTAHRAKIEFLNHMSHELLTPMNAVMGLATIIEMESHDMGVLSHISGVKLAAQTLLDLIHDILEVARLEAGEFRVTVAPFDLTLMLDTAERFVSARAQAKALSIVREVDPLLSRRLQGDRPALAQVLRHLLDNAVKFSTVGPVILRVKLLAESRNGIRVRFEVADRGIGIDPEKRIRVFSVFEQGDSSITREFQGAGVGLTICRQLVQGMGGRIGVDSEPGKGATFWFEVPLLLDGAADIAPLAAAG